MAAGIALDPEKGRLLPCLPLQSSRFLVAVRLHAKRCRFVVVGTVFVLLALFTQFRPQDDSISPYLAWMFHATPEPDMVLHSDPTWSSLTSNECLRLLSNGSLHQLRSPEDMANRTLYGNRVEEGEEDEDDMGDAPVGPSLVPTPDANAECGLQYRGRMEMLDLLKGSWLAVVGDSQARFFLVALLSLLLPNVQSEHKGLFKRHSNYELSIPEADIRFLFVWAPYEQDIAATLKGFQINGTCPDIVIMGAGLWHMLHVAEVTDFRRRLADLEKTAFSFFTSPVCASAPTLPQAVVPHDSDADEDEDLFRGEEGGINGSDKSSRLFNGPGLREGVIVPGRLVSESVASPESNVSASDRGFDDVEDGQRMNGDNEKSGSRTEEDDARATNRSLVEGVGRIRRRRPGLLFYMNLPQLVQWQLNTEKKKRVMKPEKLAAYDLEMKRRAMWFPKGPMFLLDLMAVSRECGHACTEDGMHYDMKVYLSLVQFVGRVLSLLDNLTQL